MLKKLTTRTLMLAMILLLTNSELFAQKGKMRLRFGKGRTSTTVSGKLVKGGRQIYLLGKRSKQYYITATLSSRNGKVNFCNYAPNRTSYETASVPGDNEICIENIGNSTTYTLKVSIQ